MPRFTVGSNEAYLNGHVRLFGSDNDVTLGADGFVNGQYTYRNSIATVLGSANLANPLVFACRQVPGSGGQYRPATLTEQSIIEGDALHLNRSRCRPCSTSPSSTRRATPRAVRSRAPTPAAASSA